MEIVVDLRNNRGECPFRYFGMMNLDPVCCIEGKHPCTSSHLKRPPFWCPLRKGTVAVKAKDKDK